MFLLIYLTRFAPFLFGSSRKRPFFLPILYSTRIEWIIIHLLQDQSYEKDPYDKPII